MKPPEGAWRWVLLLWLAVGLAVSVRTLVRPTGHTVFPIFAHGAMHWWADEPVYASYRPLDHFRYPPAFAIALTPLALLGLTVGGVLWSWLSLAVYAAGCWRFLREVIPERWSAGRETLFLALALFAALPGLWNAQSNALVTGLLLCGCADLVRERWWRSATWLVLAIAIKLTPLAVVLLLVALRPRELAGRVAVLLLVVLLLPFATRPPATTIDQYAGWFQQIRGTASERWPGFRDAWTLWQVARQPFTLLPEATLREPLTAPLYRAIQLGSAGLALLWVLRRRDASARDQTLLALAIGTGWLLLLGPSVEHPTFVLLAPPLLWGLLDPGSSLGAGRSSFRNPRQRQTRDDQRPTTKWLIRLAAGCILVLGWSALTEPLRPWCPILLASLPLGTLLFVAWVLVQGQGQPKNARVGGRLVYHHHGPQPIHGKMKDEG